MSRNPDKDNTISNKAVYETCSQAELLLMVFYATIGA
jgi:hypothetical protein